MARSSDGTAGNKLENAVAGTAFLNEVGPWTIAFWFKSGSTSQSSKYLGSLTGDAGARMAVLYEVFVADAIEFYGQTAGTDPNPGSDMAVTDTNWHHYAYRYAGMAGAWDKFKDGVKTSINASITFTLLTANTSTVMTLFSSGGANEVDGNLAEWGMWKTGLSDANLANMAAGTLDGSTLTTNMIYYYPLCGTASPETDLGSANKPLTVTNCPQATGPVITSTCTVAPTLVRRPVMVRQAVKRANAF